MQRGAVKKVFLSHAIPRPLLCREKMPKTMKGDEIMGRPRKVVSMSTGKIGKAARAARSEAEKQMHVKADALSPPDWLSDRAALEFDRVVRESAELGMLDNLDLAVLAVYADNYSRYADAATHINIHGATVTTKNGYETPSPWVAVSDRAAKNIFACSAKLGMSVTDRLKLIVPTKEEKSVNKYIKFFGSDKG